MTHSELRRLEGLIVDVVLVDGSILDRVPLMLARGGRIWVVANGEDTFLPLHQVVDVVPAFDRSRTLIRIHSGQRLA